MSPAEPAATLQPAPQSGYAFQSADTQALQDDAFANPGLLWVDRGAALWQQAPDHATPACSDCHAATAADGAPPLLGVANRYPTYDPQTAAPMSLEQRVNRCRELQQRQPPYPYESEPLLALTAFIASQSRGMPLQPNRDPRLTPFIETGRQYFYERRGQLNLACHHCHVVNAGRQLRGDLLSQGHSNGYPLYRLEWQSLGSLQRRLRFCNVGVRAEPLPYGASEYVNLELYLNERAAGLLRETPAVRR